MVDLTDFFLAVVIIKEVEIVDVLIAVEFKNY